MSGSGSVEHSSKAFALALGFLLFFVLEAVALRCVRLESHSDSLLTLGEFILWVFSQSVFQAGENLVLVLLCPLSYIFRPESRQDYPPNLSILISGGKENNCDALSNGE